MNSRFSRMILCVVLMVIAVVMVVLFSQSVAVNGAEEDAGHLHRRIGLLNDGVFPPAAPGGWDGIAVGGYASKRSIAQGESIDFHISTDVPTYTLTVWREGASRQIVTTTNVLSGTMYGCTDGYATGCGWPVAYTLSVPTSWPSGVYTVDISTTVKGTQHLMFWVREDSPASTSSIIFLSSVNTYQAYTNFGGKSFYPFNSSNNERSPIVSFNRPFRNDGLGDWGLEEKLVAWAEGEGFVMEYATTYDLEHVADLLKPYHIVVLAGHSEYWSWEMRQQLTAFINKGGRLINLSGNTMWWQIHYLDAEHAIANYRDPAIDPGITRPEKSSNPWDFPILDVEAAITGLDWLAGGNYGIASNDPTFRHDDGYGGYWVQHSDHWIFAGTGLADGDIFGRKVNASDDVLGDESDGTTFNCATDGKSILGPLANSGTPDNFTILGIAPVAKSGGNDLGFAMMGIYTLPGGGAVFSGSSTGWAGALGNSQVAQVTRNVFQHFLAGDFPAQPVTSTDTKYYFIDRFNCDNLNHSGVLPSFAGPKWYEGVPTHNYVDWTGDVSKVRYTEACGIRGGSGLELTIHPGFKFRSQLKPNWGTVNVLFTRVYLDFSNLVMAEGDQFYLRKDIYNDGQTLSTQADVRVRKKDGQLSMRYFDAVASQGIWVSVPSNRPFLFETMWDQSGNMLSTWVDGTRYDLSVNLAARSGLNEADFMLSGLEAGTQGHICADELAFARERIGPGLELTHRVYLPVIIR